MRLGSRLTFSLSTLKRALDEGGSTDPTSAFDTRGMDDDFLGLSSLESRLAVSISSILARWTMSKKNEQCIGAKKENETCCKSTTARRTVVSANRQAFSLLSFSSWPVRPLSCSLASSASNCAMYPLPFPDHTRMSVDSPSSSRLCFLHALLDGTHTLFRFVPFRSATLYSIVLLVPFNSIPFIRLFYFAPFLFGNLVAPSASHICLSSL